jgi:hypothetical protein
MDTQDTPGNPISSLLDKTIVQIGIIVVSVVVVWAIGNTNRRFDLLNATMYLIVPVIIMVGIAMLMDVVVWFACLLGGIRLSKKQFTRYFFGIYSVLILWELVRSFIGNMTG